MKKTKITGLIIFFGLIIFYALNTPAQINAGKIWIDNFGTSSTSGMWNSGIRSDIETTIYPPYVKRWEKYEWGGTGINVVPVVSYAYIHDGYVYFAESNSAAGQWEEPGWVWAWDIATGVTKTSYPLGPLDSGIVSMGGLVIGGGNIYTITQHKIYGWDVITGAPISGFPIDITETTASQYVYPENGIIYWNNKLYFTTTDGTLATEKSYLYVKNANNGNEIWRKELSKYGGNTPCIWNGWVYVAGRNDQKIHCFDAETGVECANFPVSVTGTMRALPVIQDGKIYIGTHSGYFYCIDAVTGAINWTYLTPIYITEREEIVSTASIWEDKVYFSSHIGALYGLYKANGMLVEGFPVDYVLGVAQDGPISTANGIVYAVGKGYSAVNANNGTLIWSGLPVYRAGGVVYTYNYPSITIGEKEIVVVDPKRNSIICWEMPSPTATMTITLTETLTETHTNTYTNTPSATITNTASKTETWTNTWTATMTPTATGSETESPTPSATASETPGLFYLKLIGNSPNPGDEYTDIIYELGREAEIEVRIYTISGERVREIKGVGQKGINSVRWDMRNRRGRGVATGVYIYSIEARVGEEKKKEWAKMAVVK